VEEPHAEARRFDEKVAIPGCRSADGKRTGVRVGGLGLKDFHLLVRRDDDDDGSDDGTGIAGEEAAHLPLPFHPQHHARLVVRIGGDRDVGQVTAPPKQQRAHRVAARQEPVEHEFAVGVEFRLDQRFRAVGGGNVDEPCEPAASGDPSASTTRPDRRVRGNVMSRRALPSSGVCRCASSMVRVRLNSGLSTFTRQKASLTLPEPPW
jgi:hypothetical protein